MIPNCRVLFHIVLPRVVSAHAAPSSLPDNTEHSRPLQRLTGQRGHRQVEEEAGLTSKTFLQHPAHTMHPQ